MNNKDGEWGWATLTIITTLLESLPVPGALCTQLPGILTGTMDHSHFTEQESPQAISLLCPLGLGCLLWLFMGSQMKGWLPMKGCVSEVGGRMGIWDGEGEGLSSARVSCDPKHTLSCPRQHSQAQLCPANANAKISLASFSKGHLPLSLQWMHLHNFI